MTQEFYSIVTEKGLEKQIKCLNDLTNFDIAYIAVGDSNGSAYTPQETQTTLKNEKWRGAVLFHGIEDGKLYATTSLPIDVGGFTIREIGLFDSSNTLLCIGKCPDTNKHDSTEGGAQELFVKIYMAISNSDLAPLIVQSSTEVASLDYVTDNFATRKFDNLLPEAQAKFDAKQDNLTSGDGIKIENNVISATNILKAGKGIAIVDDTIINTGALFEELETITINIPSVSIIEGTVYEVIDE